MSIRAVLYFNEKSGIKNRYGHTGGRPGSGWLFECFKQGVIVGAHEMSVKAELTGPDHDLMEAMSLIKAGAAFSVADFLLLLSHPSPEIRVMAVTVGALDLALPEVYPVIMRRLKGEEDTLEVLVVLIDAVAALLAHGIGNRSECLTILNHYLKAADVDDVARGAAYLNLLKIHGKHVAEH